VTVVPLSKVQEIRKVFLPKVAELRQNMRSKRAELAEQLFKAPADRLKIHAVSDQILKYRSELEREVIEHILQEKEILSDSQRKKFYDIIVGQFASGGVGVHDLQRSMSYRELITNCGAYPGLSWVPTSPGD
jgi:hypothetical protein